MDAFLLSTIEQSANQYKMHGAHRAHTKYFNKASIRSHHQRSFTTPQYTVPQYNINEKNASFVDGKRACVYYNTGIKCIYIYIYTATQVSASLIFAYIMNWMKSKTKKETKKTNKFYIDTHIYKKKKKYICFFALNCLPYIQKSMCVRSINEPSKIQMDSMKWCFPFSIDCCDRYYYKSIKLNRKPFNINSIWTAD